MASSDSDDGKLKSKRQGFMIGSTGTPFPWGGENSTFYKHAMLNAYEKSLLDQMAIGQETLAADAGQDKKDEHKKKQAKIRILIPGSFSMSLAKQVMSKKTGTYMWSELCTIYEGKTNAAVIAQKVYRLQSELHRTNLRGKDDVRSYLYNTLDIKDQLAHCW